MLLQSISLGNNGQTIKTIKPKADSKTAASSPETPEDSLDVTATLRPSGKDCLLYGLSAYSHMVVAGTVTVMPAACLLEHQLIAQGANTQDGRASFLGAVTASAIAGHLLHDKVSTRSALLAGTASAALMALNGDNNFGLALGATALAFSSGVLGKKLANKVSSHINKKATEKRVKRAGDMLKSLSDASQKSAQIQTGDFLTSVKLNFQANKQEVKNFLATNEAKEGVRFDEYDLPGSTQVSVKRPSLLD